MKKQLINIFIVAVACTFGFTSCDKDDDDAVVCETPVEEGKSVLLEFDFEIEDAPFAYNTVYDMNGVNVQFTEIRFYLSDFMLHDDAEMTESLGGAILVDAGAENTMFTVGSTEFDHIHEIHMLLGLNEVVNHEDPTLADAPLNDASMHWGWAPESGYKFVKTEVLVDTDGDGTPETAGSIHCATDDLSREIMLDVHQDTESDHIHIQADVATIYNGVDFLNLEGTHGNSELTNTVATNLAAALVTE